MPIYKCPRCGYEKERYNDIIKHISRKNMCKNIINDVIPNKDIIIKLNNKIIDCSFCKKEYSSYSSLKRHLKTCKSLKLKEKDNKVKELEEKIKELENANANANITNITNNNNIFIINVNGLRETDHSMLTDKDFLRCIGRFKNSVPELIKRVHFNPKYPENHNIYISNIRNKYAMVYDSKNKQWVTKTKDRLIDDLIVDKEYEMSAWLDEGEKYPKAYKEFNRYLDMKEEDGVLDTIREEIKLTLYNNRDFIKNK